MSAAVLCGSKRSFAEELLPSPNLAKRFRSASSSSTFTYTIQFCAPYLIEHLRSIFPQMDAEVLMRTLEECGYDVDAAIEMLQQLHLKGSSAEESSPVSAQEPHDDTADKSNKPESANSVQPSPPSNLPADGAEWVDLFVKEMMSSSNVDDAKARAAKVLGVFEKFVTGLAGAEAEKSLQEENRVLKQKVDGLVKENTILKQAVKILHKRQKEYEEKNQEFQHLKVLVPQYQEQLRTLEINNYALTLHLKQAQLSNPIPASFHPHVF